MRRVLTAMSPSSQPAAVRGALATVVCAVCLALLLYPPWVPRPIGLADFGEYAPLLRGGGDSWWGAFSSMAGHYLRRHGRLNVLTYAATALEWRLFGANAAVWYWLRFVLMLGVTGLAWRLCRKLDADRFGATAGAALFVVAGTAWQSWVTLDIGEPIGLLCMLGAACLAAGMRTSERWRPRLAVVALLCILGMLAKETLGVLMPLVWCACARDRSPTPIFRLDRRSIVAGAALALATAAVAVPVLWAAPLGAAGGYTVRYGAADVSLFRTVRLLAAIVLPVWPSLEGQQLPALVGNLAFLGLLWVGLRRGVIDPASRRSALSHIAMAVSPVILGLAVYLPWPGFAGSYALPMLIGPALLLAWAVTALRARGPRARVATGALVVTALLPAATLAHHGARILIAELQVMDAMARAVAPLPASTALVFRSAVVRPRDWGGPATDVARYASTVYGSPPRASSELSCTDDHHAAARDDVVFSLGAGCGALPGADHRISRAYRYFDWSLLRLATGRTTLYYGVTPRTSAPPRN